VPLTRTETFLGLLAPFRFRHCPSRPDPDPFPTASHRVGGCWSVQKTENKKKKFLPAAGPSTELCLSKSLQKGLGLLGWFSCSESTLWKGFGPNSLCSIMFSFLRKGEQKMLRSRLTVSFGLVAFNRLLHEPSLFLRVGSWKGKLCVYCSPMANITCKRKKNPLGSKSSWIAGALFARCDFQVDVFLRRRSCQKTTTTHRLRFLFLFFWLASLRKTERLAKGCQVRRVPSESLWVSLTHTSRLFRGTYEG